jgi:hypothetical protein
MNLTANMETDKPTDNSLEQTESKKAISSQIRTRSNQATNHNTNTTKNEEPPTTEICRTEVQNDGRNWSSDGGYG